MPCSRFCTQIFKRKDLIVHVITSLSVSKTYLPINLTVWEAFPWEMEYECSSRGAQSFSSSFRCVYSGMSHFCTSLCLGLLQEHLRLLSWRLQELRTDTAESPFQTLPRSECSPPAVVLTCLTTVQIRCCSDRLAVHHPDERLWSPPFVSRAVTGEILQISKGRWIRVKHDLGAEAERRVGSA